MLELAPEERRAQIIRNCGAMPNGERRPQSGITPPLVYFTDPLTKSTLILSIEDVTVDNVRWKLHESRVKFGIAIIELIEQFKLFILSLERTKNLPEPVVNAAANAAVMEIYSYESANSAEGECVSGADPGFYREDHAA
ncbi:MAG: hypothetical protein ABSA44_09755 [Bacteroidota bacterium]|jgi:hypothetical protein